MHALPEQQDYDSFVFKSWQAGVAFLRESYLAGCTPAACRLVDNEQFRFGHALKPEKTGAKVRRTPSWPRSWANSSPLWLHSRRSAWANLHRLG